MTESQSPVAAAPRPWILTLEVVHLSGPAFDLDQHSESVETEIIKRLADVVLHLGGRTTVRIETYMDRTDRPRRRRHRLNAAIH